MNALKDMLLIQHVTAATTASIGYLYAMFNTSVFGLNANTCSCHTPDIIIIIIMVYCKTLQGGSSKAKIFCNYI